MSAKIFVWTKQPGQPFRHVWMSNSLEAMQKAVGGYIKHVHLFQDRGVICNEEGRIILVGDKGEEFTDCPVTADLLKLFGWQQ